MTTGLTLEQHNEAFKKALRLYMEELVDQDIATIEAILVAMANIYAKHVEVNEVEMDECAEEEEDDTFEEVDVEGEHA